MNILFKELKNVNFNDLITDSLLNTIYNHKFKTIYKDSVFKTKIRESQNNKYLDILYAIENIPPCFNSTRKNIKSKVENYAKTIKEMDYYKNESFYKNGFIDGYTFLLEMQKQERNENKWVKFTIHIKN